MLTDAAEGGAVGNGERGFVSIWSSAGLVSKGHGVTNHAADVMGLYFLYFFLFSLHLS